MPSSPIARGIALLVAMSGAFTAPISALAHGHAHRHEAAEHGQVAHDIAIAEHRGHGSGDHAHPNIGAALTSKTAMALVAVVAQRVTLPAVTVAMLMPPIADATVEHRAQLAQAPPPRLRAPPA